MSHHPFHENWIGILPYEIYESNRRGVYYRYSGPEAVEGQAIKQMADIKNYTKVRYKPAPEPESITKIRDKVTVEHKKRGPNDQLCIGLVERVRIILVQQNALGP